MLGDAIQASHFHDLPASLFQLQAIFIHSSSQISRSAVWLFSFCLQVHFDRWIKKWPLKVELALLVLPKDYGFSLVFLKRTSGRQDDNPENILWFVQYHPGSPLHHSLEPDYYKSSFAQVLAKCRWMWSEPCPIDALQPPALVGRNPLYSYRSTQTTLPIHHSLQYCLWLSRARMTCQLLQKKLC